MNDNKQPPRNKGLYFGLFAVAATLSLILGWENRIAKEEDAKAALEHYCARPDAVEYLCRGIK